MITGIVLFNPDTNQAMINSSNETAVVRQSAEIYLLKRVVETAKQYFKNPQRFDEVVSEELGSEEEIG